MCWQIHGKYHSLEMLGGCLACYSDDLKYQYTVATLIIDTSGNISLRCLLHCKRLRISPALKLCQLYVFSPSYIAETTSTCSVSHVKSFAFVLFSLKKNVFSKRKVFSTSCFRPSENGNKANVEQ